MSDLYRIVTLVQEYEGEGELVSLVGLELRNTVTE